MMRFVPTRVHICARAGMMLLMASGILRIKHIHVFIATPNPESDKRENHLMDRFCAFSLEYIFHFSFKESTVHFMEQLLDHRKKRDREREWLLYMGWAEVLLLVGDAKGRSKKPKRETPKAQVHGRSLIGPYHQPRPRSDSIASIPRHLRRPRPHHHASSRSTPSLPPSRRQVSQNQSRTPILPIHPPPELQTLGGGDGHGPGRGGEGLRGALLRDVRHQPRGARDALPGRLHAHLRGRQDPWHHPHHQQAHLAPLPAVPAHHRHRRLPAIRAPGRHARLRLRLHPHLPEPRGAPPQVLPGVPLASRWTELLCAE